ncbi:hypothetical protein MANES_15G078325v8 [Manihot esculenta]|uniref:Uncharacterized protein n=1 Tax=Manihot esculenta TaxID=3983 RepID=A0ACB7GAX5_MANES|nr:hypothetical protein MANES_15G078325v8 [Manihot esculenta]
MDQLQRPFPYMGQSTFNALGHIHMDPLMMFHHSPKLTLMDPPSPTHMRSARARQSLHHPAYGHLHGPPLRHSFTGPASAHGPPSTPLHYSRNWTAHFTIKDQASTWTCTSIPLHPFAQRTKLVGHAARSRSLHQMTACVDNI